MASRVLIVNADDYGRTQASNDAITHCVLRGIVRSTTVMANMPLAAGISRLLHSVPDLGVGVHLTFTEGRPLTASDRVRSLVDDEGYFFSKRELLYRCLARQVEEDHVEMEATAQIEEVRSYVQTPTHVDSHQNVAILPRVFEGVVRAMGKCGIERMRAQTPILSRIVLPRELSVECAEAIWLPRLASRAIKRCRQSALARRGIRTPEGTIEGAPGFRCPLDKWHALLSWWQSVCHLLPGTIIELPAHPELGRAEEELLTSNEFASLLHEHNFRVEGFGAL